MRKEELSIIVDSLIPRLYGFSYALFSDELQAEQLIVDAYTVLMLKEKDFLVSMDLDIQSTKDRTSAKKYLFKVLIKEIFDLATKRVQQLAQSQKDLFEYENFYSLSISKRAMLYLKEVGGHSVKEIQEIFSLQRHQVIEGIRNSQHNLVRDIPVEYGDIEGEHHAN